MESASTQVDVPEAPVEANGTPDESSPATNEGEEDDSQKDGEIEADVQALLAEMQASFKSFSESVFAKIDQMTEKVDGLQKTISSLSADDQALPNPSNPGAVTGNSGPAAEANETP